MINYWDADVCWSHSRADTRDMWQAHVARGSACGAWRRWSWRVRCVWARGRAWQSVVARGAHACEAETSASALGRVWGGFWLFLVGFFLGLSVLSLYAFALAVRWAERWDPRVAGLWAWRRWLAFDSDYWMKARAAKEHRRCPQEPESQRNDFDTMLTI